MSTAVTTDRGGVQARGRVTQRRLLRSEWTKLWSLRSTRWSLLAAFVAMSTTGSITAAVSMSQWSQLAAHDRATFDSVDNAVIGLNGAQLAIGVLGVLVFAGEYSTGMIHATLMAAPRRLPVLWAKIGVVATVTFVLMLLASTISFFTVQLIVTKHHQQHAIGDPGALRVVIGAALFLTVLGVMTTGMGALTRSSAGGIAMFVGVLLIARLLVNFLPSSIADSVVAYLPSSAGTAVATHTLFEDAHHLSPSGGLAVFCAYAALAVAAGAVVLMRRDA
jgi:ABC-type transport system involved in multi-copper enzyme maturation permease subunit